MTYHPYFQQQQLQWGDHRGQGWSWPAYLSQHNPYGQAYTDRAQLAPAAQQHDWDGAEQRRQIFALQENTARRWKESMAPRDDLQRGNQTGKPQRTGPQQRGRSGPSSTESDHEPRRDHLLAHEEVRSPKADRDTWGTEDLMPPPAPISKESSQGRQGQPASREQSPRPESFNLRTPPTREPYSPFPGNLRLPGTEVDTAHRELDFGKSIPEPSSGFERLIAGQPLTQAREREGGREGSPKPLANGSAEKETRGESDNPDNPSSLSQADFEKYLGEMQTLQEAEREEMTDDSERGNGNQPEQGDTPSPENLSVIRKPNGGYY